MTMEFMPQILMMLFIIGAILVIVCARLMYPDTFHHRSKRGSLNTAYLLIAVLLPTMMAATIHLGMELSFLIACAIVIPTIFIDCIKIS